MFRNQAIDDSYSENVRIEKSRRSSTLSIDSVTAEDAGNYTCVGRNKAGVVTSLTELVIKG